LSQATVYIVEVADDYTRLLDMGYNKVDSSLNTLVENQLQIAGTIDFNKTKSFLGKIWWLR
jgi:hypothetical protein